MSERGDGLTKDVWEEIYQKYYQDLYIYSLALCRDHHLAQDLSSDAFFKAYLSLDDDTEHFKYWLFRVCRNLYLDHLRKNRKLVFDEPAEPLVTAPGPMEALISSEEHRRLYQSILKLPPAHREVLILFYYSGLSLQEISRIRGTTSGNAKVQLHRARLKLKSRLEGKHEL